MKKRPKLSNKLKKKYVLRSEYDNLVKYHEDISKALNTLHRAFEEHNHGNVRVTLGKTTEHEVKEDTVA